MQNGSRRASTIASWLSSHPDVSVVVGYECQCNSDGLDRTNSGRADNTRVTTDQIDSLSRFSIKSRAKRELDAFAGESAQGELSALVMGPLVRNFRPP